MAEAPPKFFEERSDKVDYAEGKEIGHSLLSLNNIYVLSVWHGEKEIMAYKVSKASLNGFKSK